MSAQRMFVLLSRSAAAEMHSIGSTAANARNGLTALWNIELQH